MSHCALGVLSCWNGAKHLWKINKCWCFATRGQEHQNGPSLSSLLPGGYCSNPNLSRQFTAQSDHQHLPPQLIMAPTSSSINLNPTCIQIRAWAEKACGLWNHRGGGSTGGSNWTFRDLPCHNVSEKVFNVISHDRLAVEIQLTVLEMA